MKMKNPWQSLRTTLKSEVQPHPTLLLVLASPSLIEIAALYALSGVYAVIATDAALHMGWTFFVIRTHILGVAWVVLRILSALLIRVSFRSRPSPSRWMLTSLPLVLITLIFTTNLDLALRLRFSQSAFEFEVDYIQALYAKGETRIVKNILAIPDNPYGLFSARVLEVADNGAIVWFKTVTGGEPFPPPYCLSGGIVYSKNGQPPERSEMVYQHLYGPWWRWVQDA
ncbi:hypothetical protein ACFLQU_03795 [Verrucomicrobiota bacterium]